MNLYKKGSLFNEGMKIMVYSYKKVDNGKSHGWERGCKGISYQKNRVRKNERQFYFTLSFTYEFEYDEDTVYFAYNIPYTYTMLNEFLDGI